jgi:site-specific recombinase XerD
MKRGHTPEHPLAALEYPRRPKRLPRVMAWNQLVEAIAGEERPRDRAMLSLLTYAGLRRGEVLSLDVRDVSFPGASVHVHGKGGKDRVVGLPGPALDALRAHLAVRTVASPEEPLFVTGAGKRVGKKVVIKAVQRVSRRLGQHVHPHMFRHSYATELLERGADLMVIKELLGHQSVATTEIYAHVSAARQRGAVRLLERVGR